MRKKKGQGVFEYVALISTGIVLVTIILLLLRGNIFGPGEEEITNKSQQFYNLMKCLEPGYFNCTHCPTHVCPADKPCSTTGANTGKCCNANGVCMP